MTIDWSTFVPRDRATLVFVVKGDQILLIDKKRGLGAGNINGPGGRIDAGETPEQCAVREVQEELCITPTGVRLAGELFFQFVDGYSIHGYVYRADDFIGTPTETDEAVPHWFSVDQIPYEKMWADDRHWLPLLLERRLFVGRFVFDGSRMLSDEVTVVGGV